MKIFLITVVIIVFGIILYNLQNNKALPSPIPQISPPIQQKQFTTIAEKLDTPWAIAFLPDKSILVTERKGTVRWINPSGELQDKPITTLTEVQEIGEGGLMGITIHPNFSSNNFIYLYYTYNESGDNTLNKVVRMTYQNNQLLSPTTIIDKIPGARFHNGGRIKFGPDNFLYITTGDAENPSQAQDINSLAGKILRVTDLGQPAPDNPFNNFVYSYGHRNPQGITWDNQGNLWETEHGPSGGDLGIGNDELNRIEIGKNYGWPIIQGDQTKTGMVTPILNSTRTTTWAPSAIAILKNQLFFGGLKGQALYTSPIDKITLKENFKNQFGRIREVILGPDNILYITTSNNDGRGSPIESDDRIIKINPSGI